MASTFKPSDTPSLDPASTGSRNFDPTVYIKKALRSSDYDELAGEKLDELRAALESEDVALHQLVLSHLDIFVRCKDAIEEVYNSDPDLFTGTSAGRVEEKYSDLREKSEGIGKDLSVNRKEADRLQKLQGLLLRIASVSHVPGDATGCAGKLDIEGAVQALVRAAQFHERQRETSRDAVLKFAAQDSAEDHGDDEATSHSGGNLASAATSTGAGSHGVLTTLRRRGFFAAWLDAVLRAGSQCIGIAVTQLCKGEDGTVALMEEVLSGCVTVIRVVARLYASKLRWLRDVEQDASTSGARISLYQVGSKLQVRGLSPPQHPLQLFCQLFGERLLRDFSGIAAKAAAVCVPPSITNDRNASESAKTIPDMLSTLYRMSSTVEAEIVALCAVEAEGLKPSQSALDTEESERQLDALRGCIESILEGPPQTCGRPWVRGRLLQAVANRVIARLATGITDVWTRLRSLIAAGVFDPPATITVHRDDGTDVDPDADLDLTDKKYLYGGQLVAPADCMFTLATKDPPSKVVEAFAVRWINSGAKAVRMILQAMMRADLEDLLVAQRVEASTRAAHSGRSAAWHGAAVDLDATDAVSEPLLRWQLPVAALAKVLTLSKATAPTVPIATAFNDLANSAGVLLSNGAVALSKVRLAALLPFVPLVTAQTLPEEVARLPVISSVFSHTQRTTAEAAVDEATEALSLIPRLDSDTPSTVIPVAVQCIAGRCISVCAPVLRALEKSFDLPSAAAVLGTMSARIACFSIDVFFHRGMASLPTLQARPGPSDAVMVPFDVMASAASGGQAGAADSHRVLRATTVASHSNRIVSSMADILAIDTVLVPALTNFTAAATLFACGDPDDPSANCCSVAGAMATELSAAARHLGAREVDSAFESFRRAADDSFARMGVVDVAALALRRLSASLTSAYGAKITTLITSGGFVLPGFDWQACPPPQATRLYVQEVLSTIVDAKDATSIVSNRGSVGRGIAQRLTEHAAATFVECLFRMDFAQGSSQFCKNGALLLFVEAQALKLIAQRVGSEVAAQVLEYRATPFIESVLLGETSAAPAASNPKAGSSGKTRSTSGHSVAGVREALLSRFQVHNKLLLAALEAKADRGDGAEHASDLFRRQGAERRRVRMAQEGSEDLSAAEAQSTLRREQRKARQQTRADAEADSVEAISKRLTTSAAQSSAVTAEADGTERVKRPARTLGKRVPKPAGDKPSTETPPAAVEEPVKPAITGRLAARAAPKRSLGGAAPTAAASDTATSAPRPKVSFAAAAAPGGGTGDTKPRRFGVKR